MRRMRAAIRATTFRIDRPPTARVASAVVRLVLRRTTAPWRGA